MSTFKPIDATAPPKGFYLSYLGPDKFGSKDILIWYFDDSNWNNGRWWRDWCNPGGQGGNTSGWQKFRSIKDYEESIKESFWNGGELWNRTWLPLPFFKTYQELIDNLKTLIGTETTLDKMRKLKHFE